MVIIIIFVTRFPLPLFTIPAPKRKNPAMPDKGVLDSTTGWGYSTRSKFQSEPISAVSTYAYTCQHAWEKRGLFKSGERKRYCNFFH